MATGSGVPASGSCLVVCTASVLLVAALWVSVVVMWCLSTVVISGVRVLISVRGVVAVGMPPPVEGLWLWLAVRAAALVYTARVEEELGGTVRRTLAAVTDSVVAPMMV